MFDRARLVFIATSLGSCVASALAFGACVNDQATLYEPCPEGTEACDEACVDTSSDAAHCGACGAACLEGETCNDGACEGGCAEGETRCGDACIPTDDDPDNCGGCDVSCDAGQVCGGGACLDSCPDGTTECGASCVDTDVDPEHCGGCDVACTSGESCTGGMCYAQSCRVLLEGDPSLSTGLYTVDPDGGGGEPPFEVACDMSTDGGGWFQLQLNDSETLLMAQSSAGNPWTKCEDDSAQHFDWIDEASVTPDSEGTLDEEVDLTYLNPQTVAPYTAGQIAAIRTAISELSVTTRMVANTADDDNGDWQNTMVSGHEVYIMGASMTWTLLTPGSDGDCGGGAGSFPTAGSAAGHYLWHSSAASSQVDGATGLTDDDLTGLGIGDLLPLKARLVVQTGGGVAFGWEKEVFLVR
jgi:hypothetical protein